MLLRLLCVLVAASVTADSWICDGDDQPAATLVAPATPEIVERTHRQQPEATIANLAEVAPTARPPSNASPVAAPPPDRRPALRLPRGLQRSIARLHLRAPTETPLRSR